MLTDYQKIINTQHPKPLRKKVDRLKKMKKQKLDQLVHGLHEEAFETIDCLACANCCITTGPLLTSKDITRIAHHLKLSEQQFEVKYLRKDEENDFVFKTMPCPFLGQDNYCSIYDVRPKACRDYPHTDRKNQQGILKLTEKNALICPAVAFIFNNLD